MLSRSNIVLFVACLAVVVVGVCQFGQGQQRAGMQKWEYKFAVIDATSGDVGLNLVGVDGWELVSASMAGTNHLAYFKRPKQ